MATVYFNKSRNLSRRKQNGQMHSSSSILQTLLKENLPPENKQKEHSKKQYSRPESYSRYSSSCKITQPKQSSGSRKTQQKKKLTSSLCHRLNHFTSSVSAFNSPRNSAQISPTKAPPPPDRYMCRESFRFLQKIGSGGFGYVWKVEFKKNSRPYAMKEISKAKVLMKKSVQSIMNEKEILCSLYSPFIVNIKCSFQDRDHLYLALDYLTGGDLRYHLCSRSYFTEEYTKFIIACIIVGLEYIHDNNIIHRDLKPENLVFYNTGYIRITDFGIARKKKYKNSNETSGTPGYMSPEVICRLNHSFEADYFALGVIAYEFMLRKRPYVGNSRKEIREHILSKQVLVSRSEVPKGWSLDSADFVNRLLQRKRYVRLGYGGVQELKRHPWLIGVDWYKLKNKEVRPPFSPRNLCETTYYLREIEFSYPSSMTCDEYQRILLRSTDVQCKRFHNFRAVSKLQRTGCLQDVLQQKYLYKEYVLYVWPAVMTRQFSLI